MDEGERYPVDVALGHLLRVFQRERTRGEVARIGVFLIALEVKPLEVLVADDGLAADDDVALGLDLLRYAVDGFGQMGDVGADVAVAAGDDLRQPSVVVGYDERQSVELPREPDRPAVGPFDKVLLLLGLGQREGGKLVGFLLTGGGVGRYLMRRRVGQHHARLLFETAQLVEHRVPLVVGHQFATTVIIGVGSPVELVNELPHQLVIIHRE